MKQLLKSTSRSVTSICLVLTFLVLSCSKSNDATPSTTSAGNGATIDGTAFAPTTAGATNTGTGLSISLKDATKEITLSTSDKVAGTYAISNTVPSGRMQATLTAVVSYFDGTDLYFGSSGSIIITIDASGNASGTFTITFKTASGKTIELKDGKFTTLAIGSPPSGKCLVSKFEDQLLEYDGEGKLVKRSLFEPNISVSEITNYFYAGGLMTYAFEIGVNSSGTVTTEEKRTYTSGKVTKVESKSSDSSAPDTYDIEYNAAGQISKVTSNWGAGSGSTRYLDVNVLEYNGDGNIVKSTVTETHDGSSDITTYIEVYSDFDNKPNIYLATAQTLGSANQVLHVGDEEGVSANELSKNNPGKMIFTRNGSASSTTTYVYEYNAKGYATKISVTNCSDVNGCNTYVDLVEYTGCN